MISLSFLIFFVSKLRKALFSSCFEMVQVASLILDESEQIKLLQRLMAIADILLNKSISR